MSYTPIFIQPQNTGVYQLFPLPCNLIEFGSQSDRVWLSNSMTLAAKVMEIGF